MFQIFICIRIYHECIVQTEEIGLSDAIIAYHLQTDLVTVQNGFLPLFMTFNCVICQSDIVIIQRL